MKKLFLPLVALALLSACDSTEPPTPTELDIDFRSVPKPGPNGWGANDERGNGNTQGYATRLRCALRLADPRAKLYELGRPFTETMPQSPFASLPLTVDHVPSSGLAFTSQVANGSDVSGSLGQQGTQMDALTHFGKLSAPWVPPAPFPTADIQYYNGFTQAQVKPTPDSGLLKAGIEKAPPIVTTAVILDMVDLLGRTMNAGELITGDMIDDALDAQGLHWRGIRPGDAVYIRTGYGAVWSDPDTTGYYFGGPDGGSPGLSLDATERLAEDYPVIVGLDNNFTDAFLACSLSGACAPPDTSLPGVPFPAHQNDLVKHGIHQIQNMDLAAIADDDVSVACTMVLALPVVGAAGSAIRPIAFGE